MRSDYRFLTGRSNSEYPERDLWAAVIARAVLDWQRLRSKYRHEMHAELKRFFKSGEFLAICEIADVSGIGEKILKEVKSSDLWSFKIGYNKFICGVCKTKYPLSEMWRDSNKYRYTFKCKTCKKLERLDK